ncbi:HPr kinase/phosphorylase [Mesorhizobium sp. YIM 152430]|uniref:HPr kinase/phosphorylase n=1 Tax=Mesorhizobium sp. YIM 152430 TaxID=3031761 RepID=UPI0023DB7817|nr:HPr kinase/phosphorylase [Mesorhizobium sp. YIM 152430]MDF1600766.1 HPr kinase/phosphorylase [Mesorhizobium sp. YIM 152430]
MNRNVHGTLVLLGDRGLLITGASGSGKSSLALDLIAHAEGFARLVSDDQVLLESRSRGRLVGRVPPVIGGRIEIRGIGIVARIFEKRAIIDLIVELVEPDSIERMPEPMERDGVPFVRVPWRDCARARQHVAAALDRAKSGL